MMSDTFHSGVGTVGASGVTPTGAGGLSPALARWLAWSVVLVLGLGCGACGNADQASINAAGPGDTVETPPGSDNDSLLLDGRSVGFKLSDDDDGDDDDDDDGDGDDDDGDSDDYDSDDDDDGDDDDGDADGDDDSDDDDDGDDDDGDAGGDPPGGDCDVSDPNNGITAGLAFTPGGILVVIEIVVQSTLLEPGNIDSGFLDIVVTSVNGAPHDHGSAQIPMTDVDVFFEDEPTGLTNVLVDWTGIDTVPIESPDRYTVCVTVHCGQRFSAETCTDFQF